LWQKKLTSAVSALGVLSGSDGTTRIVAGLESGEINCIKNNGEIEKTSELSGSVVSLGINDASVLAGTDQGQLAMFDDTADLSGHFHVPVSVALH